MRLAGGTRQTGPGSGSAAAQEEQGARREGLGVDEAAGDTLPRPWASAPATTRGRFMDQQPATQSASHATEVDEKARTSAFAALALAIVALTGGGIFASAIQWVLFDDDAVGFSEGGFAASWVGAPLCSGLLALGLALLGMRSQDPLARPVGRAAAFVAGVTLLGVLVMVVSGPPVASDGLTGWAVVW